MAQPAKFLFDIDFSQPEKSRERAASAAEIARQVADAEGRAYRAGFEAGQREAEAATARRAAIAQEDIAMAMRSLVAGFSGIEMRMETEAVEVALAAARKLCAELIAAEPLQEVMALVGDCFRQLVATPHLVVRINDRLYEPARTGVEQLARQCGFEGKLIVLAEPDIASGDCRIEWADGGVTLERAAIDAKIAELIGRYIATRRRAQAERGDA